MNDDDAAGRVREILSGEQDVVEIAMFGGLCFTVRGNMVCGISDGALMVRVGPAGRNAALGEPHVRPMTMRGKSLAAFVLVDPDGYRADAALEAWVRRGLAFAATLPAKPSPKRPPPKRRR